MRRLNFLDERPEAGFAGGAPRGTRCHLAAFAMGCLVVWAAAAALHIRSLDREIAVHQSTLPSNQRQQVRMEQLSAERAELAAALNWLNRVTAFPSLDAVLAAVGQVLPPGVTLTELALTSQVGAAHGGSGAAAPPDGFDLRLHGVAADDVAQSQMLQVLGEQEYLHDVRLLQSGASSAVYPGGTTFVVGARIAPSIEEYSLGGRQ